MIAVEDLRKRYGKTLAVDGLSFTVEPGRVVGFLGPNGAGKTTTLRILLGLVHANSGRATILGKSYAELERPFCQVGAVLEASGFHPGRKARNHLRVLARAGRAPKKRVDEVLEIVGLEAPRQSASAATRSGCASAWRWPRRCSATRAC